MKYFSLSTITSPSTVSIKTLKGEQGSKIAEKLLEVLKVSSKIDEIKRDYTSRIMEEAIELLGLTEVLS